MITENTTTIAITKLIESAVPPIPEGDRELIAAAADAHLKTWHFGTPKRAVEIATGHPVWTWNHLMSESWYREFVRLNPEIGARHARARRDHDAEVSRAAESVRWAAEASDADDGDQAGDAVVSAEADQDPAPVLNLKQFSVKKHDRTANELFGRQDPAGHASREKAAMRALLLKEAGLDEWESSAAARQ